MSEWDAVVIIVAVIVGVVGAWGITVLFRRQRERRERLARLEALTLPPDEWWTTGSDAGQWSPEPEESWEVPGGAGEGWQPARWEHRQRECEDGPFCVCSCEDCKGH